MTQPRDGILSVDNVAMSTGNGILSVDNVAMSTGNNILSGDNAAMSTGNNILSGDNAAMPTGNGILSGDNVAMPTGNNILSVDNAAMSTGNGILLGDNAAMLTSKMAMTDCTTGIRGDIARKHADTHRRTDDNASADSITQPISPDVHLRSPVTASRLRFVENRMHRASLRT